MSLVQEVTDLALRVSTEIKANKTLLNGNAAGLAGLNTTAKTNLVAALNELEAEINALQAANPAVINDAATNTTQTYSSQKIEDLVSAAITALTTGAPAALNTLDELAAALGDDANFAATITNSLANRVRVDAPQGLTGPQQAQARSNISVYSQADIGDPTTDYVAVFEAGLL